MIKEKKNWYPLRLQFPKSNLKPDKSERVKSPYIQRPNEILELTTPQIFFSD